MNLVSTLGVLSARTVPPSASDEVLHDIEADSESPVGPRGHRALEPPEDVREGFRLDADAVVDDDQSRRACELLDRDLNRRCRRRT